MPGVLRASRLAPAPTETLLLHKCHAKIKYSKAKAHEVPHIVRSRARPQSPWFSMAGSAADTIRVPPRFCFAVCDGPCSGQTLAPDLKKGFCITVGRTRASKLHIKDGAVSERHAEICWNGSSWVLKDTDSSNGTVVNGRRLTPYGEFEPWL